MKTTIFFSLLTLAFAACASTSQAGVIVVGKLARHATVKPGDPFEGTILLKNPDAQPAEARVFQTDYLSDAEGRTDYAQPGSTPRSNAGWLTVTPTQVKLAAGESISVRYKGRVPVDAKLRGTYWSLIMIEPLAAAPSSPHAGEKQVSVGLQTVVRWGVQIVTEMPGEGTRSLQMLSKCVEKAEGKRSLNLDIANNGERLLIPAVGVELFDCNGASIGRFDGTKTRIYPTCSTRAKIDLTNVPVGKYTAMVLLDSGGDQVMGAQYELAIEP